MREHNEDAYLLDDALGLYAVADGVGGRHAGEIASTTAIETATAVVRGWRGDHVDTPFAAPVARCAVEAACARVHALAGQRHSTVGMATTLTLALVAHDNLIVGHVGDSRLHLLRDGMAHQITTDHTMVAELVAQGILPPDAAPHSFYRGLLSRALGTRATVEVDTHTVALRPGDRIVLATDGVEDVFVDALEAGALGADDPEVAVHELVGRANAAGGHDNSTVVIVDVPAVVTVRWSG